MDLQDETYRRMLAKGARNPNKIHVNVPCLDFTGNVQRNGYARGASIANKSHDYN